MANSITGFSATDLFNQYGMASERTVGGDNYGKDTFLKILVAQMSNQNPLDPMSDTEFISQMAQFSSLEQMQQLNATMTNNQAYNLIGKSVNAEFNVLSADGTNYEWTKVSGVVDGVFMDGDEAYLIVGEYNVPYSAVKEVFGGSDYIQTQNAAASLLMQSASMIGKYAEGTIVEGEGDDATSVSVSGTVESIFVKNNVIYAKFGDKDVPVGRITMIGNGPNSTNPGAGDTEETETP